jgi:hypothetical protein
MRVRSFSFVVAQFTVRPVINLMMRMLHFDPQMYENIIFFNKQGIAAYQSYILASVRLLLVREKIMCEDHYVRKLSDSRN